LQEAWTQKVNGATGKLVLGIPHLGLRRRNADNHVGRNSIGYCVVVEECERWASFTQIDRGIP